MEERAYLSIGEVLSLLKTEFPDVTISKIRFLESQGLLDPERTPSGYRKFYTNDVDRLRWILRQQREHFLPLKVIKGRLRAGHEGASELDEEPEATPSPARPAARAPAVIPPPPAVTSTLATAPPIPPAAAAPAPNRFSPRGARPDMPGAGTPARTGVSLTLAELVGASGLPEDDVRELERFGLISGRRVGASVYYDEDALAVSHLAAGFMKYGVEARHLRMYKTSGEREAGFFEQVVMPMLKQRNPDARRQAVDALAELTRLGQALRAAMLEQALRPHVEGSTS
ncbi:MAG: transcriptional regulator FtsR [Acidimicrobiales bacterium]